MKNILVFGSTGFIGKKFVSLYRDDYNIISITRKGFDFLNPNFDDLIYRIESDVSGLDGILFLQGINPRAGVDDINEEQFLDMLSVNLVVPVQILQRINFLNNNASVVFISSVAQKKGSYDPSYAAAKSGLVGVQHTLANRFPHVNFNTISLGLVENSPVHRGMTDDYVLKHLTAMGGNLIKVDDVCASICLLLEGNSISNSIISVDRGFK